MRILFLLTAASSLLIFITRFKNQNHHRKIMKILVDGFSILGLNMSLVRIDK